MSSPYRSAKFILFSDFDGTITTQDSNDYMTDNLGFGQEKRRAGNLDILHGKDCFRDGFRKMLKSVNANCTFEQCREAVTKQIQIDSEFKPFLDVCDSLQIPVVIVSSGMKPIIESILSNHIGKEAASRIEIIANDAEITKDGHFSIVYRDPESPYGHDKSKALRPYAQLPDADRPVVLFCGDGVSDLSAAGESDVLFVRIKLDSGEMDLAEHCAKSNIRYVPFISFEEVGAVVKQLAEGSLTVDDINNGKIDSSHVKKALAEKGWKLP